MLVGDQFDFISVRHPSEYLKFGARVVVEDCKGNPAIIEGIKIADQSSFIATSSISLKPNPKVIQEISELGLGVVGLVHGDEDDFNV